MFQVSRLRGRRAYTEPHSGNDIGGRHEVMRTVVSSHGLDSYRYGDSDDMMALIEDIVSQNQSATQYYEIVRQICICTDAGSTNAVLAAQELKACFDHGTTSRKLRAARLWAIMLRYCASVTFIEETSSAEFLGAIKAISLNNTSHMGLCTRMLEIVAGAALIHSHPAFRELWDIVKNAEDPEEGIPFRNPLFTIPDVALAARETQSPALTSARVYNSERLRVVTAITKTADRL